MSILDSVSAPLHKALTIECPDTVDETVGIIFTPYGTYDSNDGIGVVDVWLDDQTGHHPSMHGQIHNNSGNWDTELTLSPQTAPAARLYAKSQTQRTRFID